MAHCQFQAPFSALVGLQFTSQFWSGSDRRKVQPPANFSQFKHWLVLAYCQWPTDSYFHISTTCGCIL